MTPEQHNKLHALATATTQPGPWSVKTVERRGFPDRYTVLDGHGMWVADVGEAPQDAAFIAAADPQTVLGLLDDNVGLRMALDNAIGPHCSGCGNPIDPDTCHCGQDAKNHAGEYHGFCPMGCMCGFTLDWEVLAKSRAEFIWKQQRELAEAKAEIERLRVELRDREIMVEDRGNSFRRVTEELAAMTIARDQACDACAQACFAIPRGRVTTHEKQALDDLHGTSIRLRDVGVPTPPRVDDESRCAVCQWPLAETLDKGCVRGNCSMRPLPANYYAPERAAREQADMIRGVAVEQRGKEQG